MLNEIDIALRIICNGCLRMGRISNGCVVARVRWLTHTGRGVSPSGLKSGGAKRFGGVHIRIDFRRVGEVGFAA